MNGQAEVSPGKAQAGLEVRINNFWGNHRMQSTIRRDCESGLSAQLLLG
jgi:hypothetical protein